MKKFNRMPLVVGFVGMLVLILDGKTAVSGVQSGIDLCLNTLIPSLFPFFILSSMITASLTGQSLRIIRPICKFCRMKRGTESLLAVGILGGYPIGAASIAAEYNGGRLSKAEAERMAIFCNNAGPSFLFGILAPLFPSLSWVWLLWVIQIMSTFLTGFLLPDGDTIQATIRSGQQLSVSDALNRSMRNMASVCGWVVLFRMILEFFQRWFLWIFPVPIQVLITGLLELSNGCLILSSVEDHYLRFLIAQVMLSLGGICVWMQTHAVYPELNLTRYIAGRILHAALALVISLLVLSALSKRSVLPAGIPFAVAAVFICVLRKQKKEVAFCKQMMYNEG